MADYKNIAGYKVSIFGNEVEVRKENTREIKIARDNFTGFLAEENARKTYNNINTIQDVRRFVKNCPQSSRYWQLK